MDTAHGMMRLRILHVIDSDGLYGAERVILNLSEECVSRGHDVSIATIGASAAGSDELGDAARRRGLGCIPFPMSGRADFGGMRRLRDMAVRENFDVIHSHGYRANILNAVVRRSLQDRPVVATLHGWTATNWRDRMYWYQALERHVLWRLNHVVAVSDGIRGKLPRTVRDSRTSVVPNGIPLPARRRIDSASAHDPGNGGKRWPRIAGIGRLSHEKGFDILLSAFARIAKAWPDALLRIAGTGPLGDDLIRQARGLGISDRVEFPGYVQDIEALLVDSDLFVLSSRTEGLPLSLLEAMACQVPVIATPVGQVPEVLDNGSCGIVLRSGQVEELAAAITAFLRDPYDAAQVATKAAERVSTRYSVSVMTDRYLEVYQRVCGAQ
jgi:glycosyltransferase involved in cell wall biosynthesis